MLTVGIRYVDSGNSIGWGDLARHELSRADVDSRILRFEFCCCVFSLGLWFYKKIGVPLSMSPSHSLSLSLPRSLPPSLSLARSVRVAYLLLAFPFFRCALVAAVRLLRIVVLLKHHRCLFHKYPARYMG